MHWLDWSSPDPAMNLAIDEALLDAAEEGLTEEILRFWESPSPFVVLGAGCRVAEDVDEGACRAAGVPVHRRCSGGGTVVQGPGCLNYALVLATERARELDSVAGTNRYVLGRLAAAIEARLNGAGAGANPPPARRRGPEPIALTHEGTSDLAWGPRKVSGTAQRRKKSHVLFHGTLLYDFDLSLAARCLREPAKQPDYRARRTHGEFLTNLPASREELKEAVRAAWTAVDAEPVALVPRLFTAAEALIRTRYGLESWTRIF